MRCITSVPMERSRGPAVGLFESEVQARRYVYEDKSCPRTEFEIVRHCVQPSAKVEAAAPR